MSSEKIREQDISKGLPSGDLPTFDDLEQFNSGACIAGDPLSSNVWTDVDTPLFYLPAAAHQHPSWAEGLDEDRDGALTKDEFDRNANFLREQGISAGDFASFKQLALWSIAQPEEAAAAGMTDVIARSRAVDPAMADTFAMAGAVRDARKAELTRKAGHWLWGGLHENKAKRFIPAMDAFMAAWEEKLSSGNFKSTRELLADILGNGSDEEKLGLSILASYDNSSGGANWAMQVAQYEGEAFNWGQPGIGRLLEKTEVKMNASPERHRRLKLGDLVTIEESPSGDRAEKMAELFDALELMMGEEGKGEIYAALSALGDSAPAVVAAAEKLNKGFGAKTSLNRDISRFFEGVTSPLGMALMVGSFGAASVTTSAVMNLAGKGKLLASIMKLPLLGATSHIAVESGAFTLYGSLLREAFTTDDVDWEKETLAREWGDLALRFAALRVAGVPMGSLKSKASSAGLAVGAGKTAIGAADFASQVGAFYLGGKASHAIGVAENDTTLMSEALGLLQFKIGTHHVAPWIAGVAGKLNLADKPQITLLEAFKNPLYHKLGAVGDLGKVLETKGSKPTVSGSNSHVAAGQISPEKRPLHLAIRRMEGIRHPLSGEGEAFLAKSRALLKKPDATPKEIGDALANFPTVEKPHHEYFADVFQNIPAEDMARIVANLQVIQVSKGCSHGCTMCAYEAKPHIEMMPYVTVLKIAESIRDNRSRWIEAFKQNHQQRAQKIIEQLRGGVIDRDLIKRHFVPLDDGRMRYNAYTAYNFVKLVKRASVRFESWPDIESMNNQKETEAALDAALDLLTSEKDHNVILNGKDHLITELALAADPRLPRLTLEDIIYYSDHLDRFLEPLRTIQNYTDSDPLDYRDGYIRSAEGNAADYGDVCAAMKDILGLEPGIITAGWRSSDAVASRAAKKMADLGVKTILSVHYYSKHAMEDRPAYEKAIEQSVLTLYPNIDLRPFGDEAKDLLLGIYRRNNLDIKKSRWADMPLYALGEAEKMNGAEEVGKNHDYYMGNYFINPNGDITANHAHTGASEFTGFNIYGAPLKSDSSDNGE